MNNTRIRWRYVCTGPEVGDQYHAVTTYSVNKDGKNLQVRKPTGAGVDVVLHGKEGVEKYIAAVAACRKGNS
jgi:hypothetical protein